MAKVYLSLGSNSLNKIDVIHESLSQIQQSECIINKTSSIYESESWGYYSENIFLNLVMEVITDLKPIDLLQTIQKIENQFGRIRVGKNFQDRTLDIDLLFYDNLIMFKKELIIPHILMHKRKFCLIPMCELSDKFIHPLYNKDMSQLLAECQDESHISPFYTQLK